VFVPLVNEPLEASQRCSFIAGRIDGRHRRLPQREPVASDRPPISRAAISAALNVAAMYRALETSVCGGVQIV
jgi:hypothetical protein